MKNSLAFLCIGILLLILADCLTGCVTDNQSRGLDIERIRRDLVEACRISVDAYDAGQATGYYERKLQEIYPDPEKQAEARERDAAAIYLCRSRIENWDRTH